MVVCSFFFFQAEDGIRDYKVTGVQTCALPISGTRLSCGQGDSPEAAAVQAGTMRPAPEAHRDCTNSRREREFVVGICMGDAGAVVERPIVRHAGAPACRRLNAMTLQSA